MGVSLGSASVLGSPAFKNNPVGLYIFLNISKADRFFSFIMQFL